MHIKSLTLRGYRNYQDEKIEFDDNLNIIVGKNAQGKTNILEAIFFCVIGRSFKTSKDKEVIAFNGEYGKIDGIFKREFREVEIELLFSQTAKKTIKVDKIPLHRIGELLGNVNAIFFSPTELKLVKESPEERRKFMNIDISQTNKRYFYSLSRYEKILDSRNKLLKESKTLETLKQTIDIWNSALAVEGEKIYLERKNFIEKLAPFAEKAHNFISGGKEELKIDYRSVKTSDNFKSDFLKQLQKNLEKDFKLGYTSLGVHRDEIDIFLNGVEVKNFGSQGQQRTAALSLKLAELEIIKERTGDYPILLLDDVFSELDSDRQRRLLSFTSRTQTIITCTETPSIKNAKIIEIEAGKVKKIAKNR